MLQNSEIPDSARKELACLRDSLNAAVQRRDLAEKRSKDRQRAKADILEIQKKMKVLIRAHCERDIYREHERYGNETTGRHVHRASAPLFEDLSEDSEP